MYSYSILRRLKFPFKLASSVLTIYLITATYPNPALGRAITTEIKHEQLSFSFFANDASFWYSCKHKALSQPHDWQVTCGPYEFHSHLLVNEYKNENEKTYEIHNWVDETLILKETHTQSLWLSTQSGGPAQKIISYLGFQNDSLQLRTEIKF